jgi:hypothetical protein
MTYLPRTDLVHLIIAASGLRVIPIGVEWPLHRALTRLSPRDVGALQQTFGNLELQEDREIGVRSRLADDSFAETVCSSLLRCHGTGLLARWRVDEKAIMHWRRQLLGISPESVRALAHAGKRWATLSDTVLKNVDTAAASWRSSTYAGDTSLPIVRQPALVVRR